VEFKVRGDVWVREDATMSAGITVRPFTEEHKSQVRELFISVTRLLCPPNLRDAFEAYIMWSPAEEIDRIPAYYSEKGGGFWVALEGDCLVGMFRLEQVTNDAMELRRMYVDAALDGAGLLVRCFSLPKMSAAGAKFSSLSLAHQNCKAPR
jgi:hypothetical protein